MYIPSDKTGLTATKMNISKSIFIWNYNQISGWSECRSSIWSDVWRQAVETCLNFFLLRKRFVELHLIQINQFLINGKTSLYNNWKAWREWPENYTPLLTDQDINMSFCLHKHVRWIIMTQCHIILLIFILYVLISWHNFPLLNMLCNLI